MAAGFSLPHSEEQALCALKAAVPFAAQVPEPVPYWVRVPEHGSAPEYAAPE